MSSYHITSHYETLMDLKEVEEVGWVHLPRGESPLPNTAPDNMGDPSPEKGF